MESILSLFVFHDTYVVSFLVIAITIIVVMLLLFGQKGPKSVVRSEIEDSENIEGALRRVLGEQSWNQRSVSSGEEDVSQLQKEVLDKDRKIAELNKQLTQASGEGGDGSHSGGDNSELFSKISELEARLLEYEIIEDDIADLSLYKTENEKLKEELARLKALAGEESDETIDPSVEEDIEEESPQDKSDPEIPVEPEKTQDAQTQENDEVEESEPIVEEVAEKVQPADLVAEFEKVVNSQEDLEENSDIGIADAKADSVSDGGVKKIEDVDSGKVMVKDSEASQGGRTKTPTSKNNDPNVHIKLRDVNPDSKEEADIFINELKALKKES